MKCAYCNSEKHWAWQHDKVTGHVCYSKEVAAAILEKIRECQFKTGRDTATAFKENNLPNYIKNDTVVLLRRDLEKFHDDFALLTMFIAHILQKADVAPIDIIAHLTQETR